MDQNAVPPPPPPPPYVPAPPAALVLPWEIPGRPAVDALVETVKLIATSTDEAFRRMPVVGDIARPLLYGVIIGSIGPLLARFYSLFLPNPLVGFLQRSFPGRAGEWASSPGIAGFFVVPIAVAVGLFLGAGIVHLCLMLVSGATGGYLTTFRVICYASPGQLFQVIPFLGGLLALVFVVLLEIKGLAIAHRTTTGKAAAAVLIPIAFCCVCVVGVIVAFGAALAGFMSR